MPILSPTKYLKKVTDINLDMLSELSVNTLLLDIDNTLAIPEKMEPFKGVLDWINILKKANIKLIIISNNYSKRVKPFAQSLNVPFVSVGLKPLPFKIMGAIKKAGSHKSESLLVGDQIFTDILGANLSNIKSILLEPSVKTSEKSSVRLRRFIEKPIRRKLKDKLAVASS